MSEKQHINSRQFYESPDHLEISGNTGNVAQSETENCSDASNFSTSISELSNLGAANTKNAIDEHDVGTDANSLYHLYHYRNHNSIISTLSEQQRAAYNTIMAGKNVHIGGIAGSGKSYLINAVRVGLKRMNRNVVVVGTTGISAINVGGKTLHSWAMIGIAKDYAEICNTYLDAPRRKMNIVNIRRRESFRSADVLIIDEVSMLTNALLDALNKMAKRLRNSFEPMGGIQIILVGDFCQLPPVTDKTDRDEGGTPYCFLSSAWSEIIDEHIFLTDNFRQKEDADYYNLLLSARDGNLSSEHVRRIMERIRPPPSDTDIKATILYSRNVNVDRINNSELQRLVKSGRELVKNRLQVVATFDDDSRADVMRLSVSEYKSVSEKIIFVPDKQIENIRGHLVKTNQLHEQEASGKFVIGAQVMCTVNIPFVNLVNGSRGVIVDVNAYGNFHVPVVEFKDGNKIEMPVAIKPCTVPNKLYGNRRSGNALILVAYIPLRLAWALTIHKSQGLTLDMVQTSLGRDDIFDYGMGYVAMSRVKNLNSLYLDRFDPAAIFTDPEVKRFYDLIKRYNRENGKSAASNTTGQTDTENNDI